MKRTIHLMLFFVYSLLLISLLACSDSGQTNTEQPPPGSIQKITWVSPYYTPGIEPDVAFADDGTVVQVHDSGSGQLWYKVGEVKGPVIVWGKDHDYDTGGEPSVAFTDSGLVVEVHRSRNDSGLWYHVGEIQKTGDSDVALIDWGPSRQIYSIYAITPNDPSVAVGGTTVVVASSYDGSIDCQVGILNIEDKTISWRPNAYTSIDAGVQPDITVKGSTMIAVHRSGSHNTLWYNRGILQTDGGMMWGPGRQYDTGTHPSVSLLNDGTVVETHTGEGSDNLWGRVGRVDLDDRDYMNNVIEWSEYDGREAYKLAKNLGKDHLPTAVAVRNCAPGEPLMAIFTTMEVPVWYLDTMINFYVQTDDKSYLRDELALILDGPNGRRIQLAQERWMELSTRIENLSLRELRLIGSHDAASSGISGSSLPCVGYNHAEDKNIKGTPSGDDLGNARCQSESILTQLRAGVRFFDMRVALQGGEYYSEHMWLAGLFAGEGGILQQFRTFFEESPNEVIIISTSAEHIYSDTTDNGLATTDEIDAYFKLWINGDDIPNLLAKPISDGDVLAATLKDVRSQGKNIIYIGPESKYLNEDSLFREYTWQIKPDAQGAVQDGGVRDLEIKLKGVIEKWIKEGNNPDKLRLMSTNIYGGGKIGAAGVANPMALNLMLSKKDAIINLLQINDAVNTPDWVRVFLLNWMPDKQ